MYVAACILIPAIWGLIVAAIYEGLAAHRKRSREANGDDITIYSDFEI